MNKLSINKLARLISALLVLPLTFAFQTALAGDLTLASVTPSSLQSNATNSVSIRFTTTSELPSNGKIKVLFPAGFNVASVTTSNCSLWGTYSVSSANQLVTLTRNSALGSITAGTGINCQLDNIKNPDSGTTGTFNISTTSNNDVVIDQINNIAGITFSNGNMTNASITPVSLQPKMTGNATVQFTLNNPLPSNGKIEIGFPAGFDISRATTNSCTQIGTFKTSIVNQTITISRTGNLASITSGQVISCELGNIKNPDTGTTGTFDISTLSSDNVLIDTNSAVPRIVIGPSVVTPPNSYLCSGFTDVSSTDPLCPAITYVANQAIFSGYPDGTFQANTIINRVETIKVVLLGFARPVTECVDITEKAFSDTDPTQWYCRYVHTAKDLGIISGYPDGNLRPNQQINRVEMLKIFFASSFKDLSSVNTNSQAYRDTEANAWYSKYIQFAKDNNLMDASVDGYFYPSEGMKRGDVAELFYRYHLAGL